MTSVRDIVGDAHFFEETVTSDKIKKLLDNVASGSGMAAIMEKTEGMKYLLAMQSQGRDVSEFYPDVVRNVIVKNVELKKLVYMYLVHNADANATCRELALLAINSFQRDLAGPNQLIRSLALRVMCSIRVKEIVQIQLLAVKKCSMDSSPYVRKTAAHSLSKIYTLDNDQKPELVNVISKLLGDRTVMVLGSVVTVFTEVCPERLDLLHPHYRKLCQVLPDVDEWGQIMIINLLLRYARTQFLNPKGDGSTPTPKKKASGDSSDSEEESTPGADMDEDHKLFLRCCMPLLKSRNAGVVLAVASVVQYIGPGNSLEEGLVGKALVRVMRNHREVQFVVLNNIFALASASPAMFRKHIKDFYVSDTEPAFVRKLKMEILALLVSGENSGLIMKEFTRYVADADPNFVVACVLAVGRIADTMPDLAPRVLGGLMGLVNHPNESVVAASVVVIRQLLQRHPANDLIIQKLVHRLPTIKIPAARSAIVWILGEFQSHDAIAKLAPDALRQLVKDFKSEDVSVKTQILNLASKLALRATGPSATPVQLLLRYVLEMAKFDEDYDLRDRARFLRRLILAGPSDALNLAARASDILLAPKPAPLPLKALGASSGSATRASSSTSLDGAALAVGSLSLVVGHTAPGYTPLPAFPTVKPNPKVRDEAPPDEGTKSSSKAKAKPAKKEKKAGAFYSDDEKPASSSSSSSEEEESSSEESESGSGSDSGSGSGSGSSSEEDGDDSSDAESSSEEEDDSDEE